MKHIGTQTVIAPPDGKKVGDLRVWWTFGDSAGHHMDYYQVADVDEAKKVLKELTDKQVNDDSIDFNAGGLETWDGKEWSEWMDDAGHSIDDLMEE